MFQKFYKIIYIRIDVIVKKDFTDFVYNVIILIRIKLLKKNLIKIYLRFKFNL